MALLALTRVLVGMLMIGIGVLSDTTSQRLCVDTVNRPLCYTEALDRELSTDGISAALDLMGQFYVQDPKFSNYCHGNAHDIGDKAYALYHTSGEIEITPKASYCGFGFYHGFMEAMYAESGSMSESRDFCRAVGEKMHDVQPYAEGACYHGIGHGVTDGTDPSLWGDPLALAEPGIRLCREIANTDDWLMRCSSGVFNSLALLYQDAKYKLGRPEDPFLVCEEGDFAPAERTACYSQMNTLVAFLGDHKPEKVLAYTKNIKDATLRRTATVNAAAMPRQWKDVGEVASIPICRSLGSEFSIACLRGVVSGMMEFGIPGHEADAALEFCNTPSLSTEERRECASEIITMGSGMFTPERLKELCNTIPHADAPQICARLN